jgi:dephospho-CoA kinase
MVKVIGLTGGIATGKTTVSKYLNSIGYQIIDADKITHKVQKKGSEGLDAIATFFGSDILNENGELNRSRLGNMVFSNNHLLRELVRIIDPYIRKQIITDIQTASHAVVILDAPTLFENGYHYLCDEIIVVTCSYENQLKRLMQRDQLPQQVAKQRINSQWPLDVKVKLANHVINSNGSIMQTREQVVKLFNN